jgi:hypothetical protein
MKVKSRSTSRKKKRPALHNLKVFCRGDCRIDLVLLALDSGCPLTSRLLLFPHRENLIFTALL